VGRFEGKSAASRFEDPEEAVAKKSLVCFFDDFNKQ
jgi:hypothetical protein